MSIPHALPGYVVIVQPLGRALASAQTQTLVRGEELEVIKLILPPGKEIPEHRAKGDVLVQCLEGQIALTTRGRIENLRAGEFVYLPTGESHSVRSVEPASVLLTVVLPRKDSAADWGGVPHGPLSAEREEAIYQRGLLLSVGQAAFLLGGLGLLLAVAGNSVLVTAIGITAGLAILACLHYWTWGRRLSRATREEGPRTPPAGAQRLRFTSKQCAASGAHRTGE